MNPTKQHATLFLAILAALFIVNIAGATSIGNTTTTDSTTAPLTASYTITSRSANTRVWNRIIYETNQLGVMTSRVRRYKELATGIAYETNGLWLDSQEVISPEGTAFSAMQGRHHAHWNAEGVLTMTTPSGQRLNRRW